MGKGIIIAGIALVVVGALPDLVEHVLHVLLRRGTLGGDAFFLVSGALVHPGQMFEDQLLR